MNKLSATIAVYLMSAAPVFAADVAHDLAEGIHEAEHASKGGLPQFDPSTFASQFFWLAISFAVLYVIFSKITLPEISSVIENRKNHIDSDLQAAEKLTAEADEVHDTYEAGLAKANQKASDALAAADAKIKKKAEKKNEEFRQKSETELQAAEARIMDAKAKAMAEMNKVVAEVAATAVEKITGSQTDTNKIQSIVENIDNSRTKKAKAA